ncbi:putative ribonuclease H-like domain-containing protein [Tanacetum coccineum]
MMVTQELVANAMNDVSRQAFEEEKRIIASQKKAAQATSTNQLSTDRPFVSTDRPFVSTDRSFVSTDRSFVSTDRSNTPNVSVASTSTGANANESSFVYLGGKIPIDASTLPNVDLPIDPNMPDLEDASDSLPNDGIFNGAYDDDKDVGAVANFNNMDNTIAVSPIPTLRIHKDHPKGQILGDPTSAVQTRGKIQKASSAQQALVWILVDLPFGKKEIGIKWVFRNKKDERSIVVKNKARLVAQVYVDDIIFGSTKKSMCTELEEVMHKRFQSSMGELTFFLGLQVKQQPDGIFISQDRAAMDQGEGSAQPAEPHHTPVDPIPSTSQPPHSPHPSLPHPSPPHPSLPHPSPPHPSPLHQSPPHFSPPRSYKAPLPEGNTSGSAEDKGEEPEDQGRKIQDINDDPLVSLVKESMKEKLADFVSPTKALGRLRKKKSFQHSWRQATTCQRMLLQRLILAREEINCNEEFSTRSAKEKSVLLVKAVKGKRKASNEDWDVIRAKLEANAELSKDVLGKDLPEQDFAKRMVDMVNQRKKHFAEERAKAKRNKPMTQSQLRIYMSNYLKNQGTWKLSQLKKLKFEEIKEEFDKFDDKDVPAIGEKVVEVKEEEPVKRTGKRKKQKARKGINVDKSAQEDSETDKEESIMRANGADMVYMSFRAMVKDFTREDLIMLYRTMFDPPLNEDAIWSLPLQQKMVSWRYYDKCEVHCLTLEACTIYMLADRKYPLSKDACQVMLKMKLLDGKMNEVCYKLLKMIEKQAGIRK